MTSTQVTIALVTGANRGIGLEVCRQLARQGMHVLLGARDRGKGEDAAADLKREGLNVEALVLDVSSADSITHARDHVQQRFGRLDVLVNNAAIHYDTWENILNADMGTVREALETNTLGAWQMCQAFVPLLRRSAHGRIVNVASEAGSLESMGSGTPAYNLSKVGLNAITRMLASALHSDHILVNSVCPGWVATDMGGAGGRPVQQGAASVLWAVNLPDNGPTGGFFRDGKPLAW
jgi:NAD(P)-dependent dehydrogenase (short-subunit alcohol dehydrogenase family)